MTGPLLVAGVPALAGTLWPALTVLVVRRRAGGPGLELVALVLLVVRLRHVRRTRAAATA